MKEHLTRLRVRYAETDAMGVAHHAGYAVWFEVGRGELTAVPIAHPGFSRQFTLLHPPEGLASHAAWAFTLASGGLRPRPPAP